MRGIIREKKTSQVFKTCEVCAWEANQLSRQKEAIAAVFMSVNVPMNMSNPAVSNAMRASGDRLRSLRCGDLYNPALIPFFTSIVVHGDVSWVERRGVG
jgi:hypothetical protein